MVKTYDIVTVIEMIEDTKKMVNNGTNYDDIIKSLIWDGADSYDAHVMIGYVKYLNHADIV